MVVETVGQRDELQAAITNLELWSSKCHMMHLGHGNKRFEYVMAGQVLETVVNEKDVWMMIHHLSSVQELQRKLTRFWDSYQEQLHTETHRPS